jgi:dolichol-phosphate mannosyltransferase
MSETKVKYSIVVPLFNEQAVVEELYARLTKVMQQTRKSYELVLVDDGSSDGTLEKLKQIAEQDEYVVVVELRRNLDKRLRLRQDSILLAVR